MARYCKLYPLFWDDEKILALSIEDKCIAAYCLTSRQTNRVGIFPFSPAMASESLGLDAETFLERFRDVVATLNWGWDPAVRVLYIPSWWRYNPPDNPNVLKGNLSDLAEVPQTALLQDFMSNMEHLEERYHDTFQKRIANVWERLPKPSAKVSAQNQNQNGTKNESQNQKTDLAEGKPTGDERADKELNRVIAANEKMIRQDPRGLYRILKPLTNMLDEILLGRIYDAAEEKDIDNRPGYLYKTLTNPNHEVSDENIARASRCLYKGDRPEPGNPNEGPKPIGECLDGITRPPAQ